MGRSPWPRIGTSRESESGLEHLSVCGLENRLRRVTTEPRVRIDDAVARAHEFEPVSADTDRGAEADDIGAFPADGDVFNDPSQPQLTLQVGSEGLEEVLDRFGDGLVHAGTIRARTGPVTGPLARDLVDAAGLRQALQLPLAAVDELDGGAGQQLTRRPRGIDLARTREGRNA